MCIKKMPGVRSIAMISVRTTISLSKKMYEGLLIVTFLLLILVNKFLDQNDVEFDFKLLLLLYLYPFS